MNIIEKISQNKKYSQYILKHSLLRTFWNYNSFHYQLLKLKTLEVDNGMSYNSETSLINYVSKYIGCTFYSEIS